MQLCQEQTAHFDEPDIHCYSCQPLWEMNLSRRLRLEFKALSVSSAMPLRVKGWTSLLEKGRCAAHLRHGAVAGIVVLLLLPSPDRPVGTVR